MGDLSELNRRIRDGEMARAELAKQQAAAELVDTFADLRQRIGELEAAGKLGEAAPLKSEWLRLKREGGAR